MTPIDETRPFHIHELFFSTTDRKGHIEVANRIFIRVSDHSSSALKGAPHNIIRHPDMPRAVFKLLWDRLEAGSPVVAYVKNLAADGRFYWVLALILPIADGYLSVRFKPTSPLFDVVQRIYREMKEIECTAEASGGKKAGIAAGSAALLAKLETLGFKSYRDFMLHAFQVELHSREKMNFKQIRKGFSFASGFSKETGEVSPLAALGRETVQALAILNSLFGELDAYARMNTAMLAKCAVVTSLSESIRMLSLNGAIEAERLGETAVALSKVLERLGTCSDEITDDCAQFSAPLQDVVTTVQSVVFALSAAKLEIEMATQFVRELLLSEALGSDRDNDLTEQSSIQTLIRAFTTAIATAEKDLLRLDPLLKKLEAPQESLFSAIRYLRIVHLTAKMEMAVIQGSQLETIFASVNVQLDQTEASLDELRGLSNQLAGQLRSSRLHLKKVKTCIERLDAAQVSA